MAEPPSQAIDVDTLNCGFSIFVDVGTSSCGFSIDFDRVVVSPQLSQKDNHLKAGEYSDWQRPSACSPSFLFHLVFSTVDIFGVFEFAEHILFVTARWFQAVRERPRAAR